MKPNIVLLLFFMASFYSCNQSQTQTSISQTKIPYAIVIHGGAGYINNLPPEVEKAYKEKLNEALNTGYLVLKNGGTAIEAVQKTINVMEDSPLFNAGKGCVLNSKGKPEMDASIMDGSNLNCGAVAGVSHIKNPINAALLVKDSTRHVLLAGQGAEEFCKQYDIIIKDETYFVTQKRLKQLQQIQNKEHKKTAQSTYEFNGIKKYGTVGCVALDKQGHLAAGTSTGGLMNKQYGRIGDSPIIGAGTYADDQTCGISCTGTGEYFIRTVAAYNVSALMKYQNLSLHQTQKQTIKYIQNLGGDGGMIGIDKQGNIAWFFNTKGMFRAYKKSTGEQQIKIYAQ